MSEPTDYEKFQRAYVAHVLAWSETVRMYDDLGLKPIPKPSRWARIRSRFGRGA